MRYGHLKFHSVISVSFGHFCHFSMLQTLFVSFISIENALIRKNKHSVCNRPRCQELFLFLQSHKFWHFFYDFTHLDVLAWLTLFPRVLRSPFIQIVTFLTSNNGIVLKWPWNVTWNVIFVIYKYFYSNSLFFIYFHFTQNTHTVWHCPHNQVTPIIFISPLVTIQGVTRWHLCHLPM